jgi:membrane protease YdiL (CAAX protease family)
MTPSDRPADPSGQRPGERAAARAQRPIPVFAAAGWTLGLSLLVMLVMQITEAARPGAGIDLVNQTAVVAFSYSLVLLLMLRVYAPSSPMREALGFHGVGPLHVILSAIAGAGIAPALAKLDALVLQRFPLPQEIAELDRQTLSTGKGVLIVSLVFVMPIADEVFFRGVLFTGIKRARGAGVAMLATSLLYAVSLGSGFDARDAASALVLGLVLSLLRAQSGSLVSSAAAHVAYTAVSVVPLAMGKEAVGDVPLKWVPMKWVALAMGAAITAVVAGGFLAAREEEEA